MSVPALVGMLGRLSERVTAKSFTRQLATAVKKLSEDQRTQLVAQLDDTRDALDALRDRLKIE